MEVKKCVQSLDSGTLERVIFEEFEVSIKENFWN